MDCEKFDQHVIDALYDELDELTDAALRRHVEGCTRCAQIFSQLKEAREAATMPLVEPSSSLEERILAAEKATVRKAPLHNKVIRGIAWAGSLAMRPQLAMAALFMLIVGSSLLLLRGKPNALNSRTEVTQRGEPGDTPTMQEESPQRAKASDARAARPEPVSPTMGASPKRDMEAANDAPRPQSLATSESAMAPPPAASAASSPSPRDELDNAQQLKAAGGCGAALEKFKGVAGRYPDTPEGMVAKSELEKCKPATTATAAKPSATLTPLAH